MLEKIQIFKDIRHSLASFFWYFLLEGVLLLALGVLVVIYPQIIILLFALGFIIAGAASLWIATRVRRTLQKFDKFLNSL